MRGWVRGGGKGVGAKTGCLSERSGTLFRVRLAPSALPVTVLVVAVMAIACSSPEKLAGEGSECFLTTDCQEGLACITQTDGTRRCSSDLSSIQDPAVPSGGDAAAASPEGGGDAGVEAEPPPTDATTPPPQDAPPPPADASTPPQDVAAPPPDVGTPPQEASPPPPPPQEAAPPPPQDASAPQDATGAGDSPSE